MLSPARHEAQMQQSPSLTAACMLDTADFTLWLFAINVAVSGEIVATHSTMIRRS